VDRRFDRVDERFREVLGHFVDPLTLTLSP
jgi:hypothetical protein